MKKIFGRALNGGGVGTRKPRLSIWSKLQLAIGVGACVPLALAVWQTQRTITASEYVLQEQLDDFLDERAKAVALRWEHARDVLATIASAWPVDVAIDGARPSASPPVGWFLAFPGDDPQDAYPNRAWTGLDGLIDVSVADTTGRTVWQSRRVYGETPSVSIAVRIPALGTLTGRITLASLYPALSQERPDLAIGIADVRTGAMLLGANLDVFREWDGGARITSPSDVWIVRRQRLLPASLELRVAEPTSPILGQVRRTAEVNLFALLIGSAVAMTAAWVIAAGVASSLNELANGADAIASGNLTTRLALGAEGENTDFDRVARAFNTMAENLTKTLRRLSQRETLAATSEFAARLAHEVRNPLTSVKIDVQRLQRRAGVDSDGTATRLLTQLNRLERYVADTLGALKWEKRERRQVDMSEPIRASAHAAGPHFEEANAVLTVQAPIGRLWARVDGWALEQVILNLLINAAQAVESGGQAWLTAEESRGTVIIEVADNGPGIPVDLWERVFDVFFTTKPDGSGLGLSIAREIVEEHGGSLRLGARPGGGTIALIELPSCPAPSEDLGLAAPGSVVLAPVTSVRG